MAYRRGELSLLRRWQIGRHLRHCQACRDVLSALEEMSREVVTDMRDSGKFPGKKFPSQECLSEEILEAYKAGSLPDAHRDLVLDHLVECPFCARQLEKPGKPSSCKND